MEQWIEVGLFCGVSKWRCGNYDYGEITVEITNSQWSRSLNAVTFKKSLQTIKLVDVDGYYNAIHFFFLYLVGGEWGRLSLCNVVMISIYRLWFLVYY